MIAHKKTELEYLQEENAILREQVARLRKALSPLRSVAFFKLSKSEERIFSILLRQGYVSRSSILDFLYLERDEDEPYEKILDVFVCRLRKKLGKYGISVQTVWGQGYALTKQMRQKAYEVLDAEQC